MNKEDVTVTITVEELAEYIRDGVILDTIRKMVYATAYLSYDGESLRNTADVMTLFRYLDSRRYKRELFYKKQEKESKESEANE